MFIQTENTPNPDTIKFLPGKDVSPSQNHDFRSSEDAQRSPLATGIFKLDGIAGVFLGRDFISVTKDENTDWLMLKAGILSAIMDFYSSGKPVLQGDANEAERQSQDSFDDSHLSEDDQNIVKTIRELLDSRIRPAVAQDGGDIIFHNYENGIVYLEMHGACSGCPSASITLKAGIENMLKHYIPEIAEVRAVA